MKNTARRSRQWDRTTEDAGLALRTIADLPAEIAAGGPLYRQVIAGAGPAVPALPLLAGTRAFTTPYIAHIHTAQRASPERDVACYVLQDAVVSGDGQIWLGGRLITSPEVMPEYVARLLDLEHGGSRALHAAAALPVRTITTPCLVATGHGIHVYGHFLIEMLFRILLWRHAMPGSASHQRLLLDRAAPPWLLRILHEHLQVGLNDIEFFDPRREQVFLPQAVVPSGVLLDDHFHPFANQLLTSLGHGLQLPPRAPAPQRIFAARGRYVNQHAPHRICVNEQELIEMAAEDYGFMPVALEALAWPQQIALFRGADIIVGQAGSGLHNALFCRPGSRVGCIGFMNLVQSAIGNLRGQSNAFLTRDIHLAGEFEVDPAAFRAFLGAVVAT